MLLLKHGQATSLPCRFSPLPKNILILLVQVSLSVGPSVGLTVMQCNFTPNSDLTCIIAPAHPYATDVYSLAFLSFLSTFALFKVGMALKEYQDTNIRVIMHLGEKDVIVSNEKTADHDSKQLLKHSYPGQHDD